MSKNEIECERYQARLKLLRDNNMYWQDALKKKVGILNRIKLCQRLLKLPAKPQSELLELPIDEIHTMAPLLENQLAVRVS